MKINSGKLLEIMGQLKIIRHYTNRLLTIEEDAKLMPITAEERRDLFHMSWVLQTDPKVMQSREAWGDNYIVGIILKESMILILKKFQSMTVGQHGKEIPLKFQGGSVI